MSDPRFGNRLFGMPTARGAIARIASTPARPTRTEPAIESRSGTSPQSAQPSAAANTIVKSREGGDRAEVEDDPRRRLVACEATDAHQGDRGHDAGGDADDRSRREETDAGLQHEADTDADGPADSRRYRLAERDAFMNGMNSGEE
jgi:hypothetical protein